MARTGPAEFGVLRQLHACDEAARVERNQCLNVFVGRDFTGVAPALHPSCFHVHVIAVALEGHRDGFGRELRVFLHGELADGVASGEELRAERYLDVRVDEGRGGIAVVTIHGREERCDCPFGIRVSGHYEAPPSLWPLSISQFERDLIRPIRASFSPLSVADPLEPSTDIEEPVSAASLSLSRSTAAAALSSATTQEVRIFCCASSVS